MPERSLGTFERMHVVCVAGARPNFMKIAPVLSALEARDVRTTLVHTGQHYDDRLSQVFFDELGIRPPDHHLEVGSGTQGEQVAKVMLGFEPLVIDLQPDAVVVVGDVNSTAAAALVTAKLPPLVAHVEAGLRSRDWDMPEEVNRVVTDRVSDLLLAPSADAVDNLIAEGCPLSRIHLVGNVMVDTLLANLERARARDVLDDLALEPGGYGLLTLHRPSNVDDPAVLGALLATIAKVAERVPVIFPVHPRTARQLEHVAIDGLQLTRPFGYFDFLALQASAAVVLTDSGGIQEETTVLGVPCITLRETTERPITVTEGTNVVVGTDPARIIEAVDRALAGEVEARRPALWDGHASDRIAEVLLADAGSSSRGWT